MNGYVQDERYTVGAGMRRNGAFQFCTVFDAGSAGAASFNVGGAGVGIVLPGLAVNHPWGLDTRHWPRPPSRAVPALTLPVSYGPGNTIPTPASIIGAYLLFEVITL